MAMRELAVVALVTLLAVLLCAAPSEKEAQAAAEAWLGLVDSEKYGESWAEASSDFRSRVTKEKWEEMAKSVRESVGTLVSRKLREVTFTKTLPGAPDGEYAVLVFESSFQNKRSGVETAVMIMEQGKWKGAGYFIR
jgi:hypothetical protein